MKNDFSLIFKIVHLCCLFNTHSVDNQEIVIACNEIEKIS